MQASSCLWSIYPYYAEEDLPANIHATRTRPSELFLDSSTSGVSSATSPVSSSQVRQQLMLRCNYGYHTLMWKLKVSLGTLTNRAVDLLKCERYGVIVGHNKISLLLTCCSCLSLYEQVRHYLYSFVCSLCVFFLLTCLAINFNYIFSFSVAICSFFNLYFFSYLWHQKTCFNWFVRFSAV